MKENSILKWDEKILKASDITYEEFPFLKIHQNRAKERENIKEYLNIKQIPHGA